MFLGIGIQSLSVVRKLSAISSMEQELFAHELLNPPAEDRKCEVDLSVVNSKGGIVLDERKVNLQTRYLLKVPDPRLIGFIGSNEKEVRYEMLDLVLGCNLALERTCLSTLRADLSTPEVDVRAPEPNVEIEHAGEGVVAHVTRTHTTDAYLIVKIIAKEELDESRAIDHLGLLRKLGRHELSSDAPIQALNLSKALSEFEQAMTVFPRRMIFKHLFNSLELSTNSDGFDRTGESLDKEVAKVSGIAATDVEKWRKFYVRTKHVDRTPRDITEFDQGQLDLPITLIPLRRASTSVITDRLRKLP